ncbi:MAG TPA: FHA domain-containing protein, partial [Candidatus Hydrogenedentes bacterium]|nr:FHA domain-containing protein [Candidatus Hydrogenedentota bacterium]
MAQEHLVVLSGTLKGHKIPIQGQLTIGRNPDSGLQLDDLQVSRRHALIEPMP